MTIFNPISEAQFLVKFSKYGSFLFTEKTGGDIEFESSEFANGSGMEIHNITGPRKVSPVILKAPFDPQLQAYLDPIIFKWECEPGVITVTPVDCQGLNNLVGKGAPIADANAKVIALGEPYIYTGARLKKYTVPNVDRKSANAAMIELEFVIDSVTRGPIGDPAPTPTVTGGSKDLITLAGEFLGQTIG